MKSNFQFIASQWPDIYAAAQEAEQQVYRKSITSGMFCRQAMELMLNWVYFVDTDYELPYQNTLAAKLREDCFKADVDERIIRELEYIRRIGNNAIHSRKITSTEALASIKFLFHFFQYVTRTYTDLEFPNSFAEDFIPTDDPVEVALREVAALKESQREQLKLIEKQRAKIEEDESRKSDLEKLQIELAALKSKNQHIPIPDSDISEAQTRRLFIDADLKSIAWDLSDERAIEFEVDNMPRHINPTGKGFIDYVLWGKDGLPLAIIEAKKTCVDAAKGKAQAGVYADCLEKKYNRRPIIFYTNGFETWIWDDQFYPPRKIYGFYSQEQLQLLMDRRRTRKDLRKFFPQPNIAGRYYQKEAIKRIAENLVSDGPNGLVGKRRKSLLVMATGTGKTRTAVALVDILLKANWAKRVLFLADRNALVTQAKRSFNEHLGHLTAINLSKEREDDTTRLVFSTYPTIMNRIDDGANKDGVVYGVGHFDLIIVDEAHRSIYKKYEDIFTYFDAMIVGLTATPRSETHKDTYQAFECENGNPTYYYELDTAVKDKFLVPPFNIPIGTKFLRRGIKHSELTDEEKEAYEKMFALRGEEPPKEIDAAAINKWLFNKDTVIKILNELMTRGVKVESGDKIGKTIIFARSQAHAEFIEKIFNEQYPEHSGHFLRTISYKDQKFAQDLIDKFKEKDRYPQIAVSVDMLETGIDVPEIVNLVLFRPIYSKTKFWQIIGRGTRLCENLFGVEKDKKHFYVFDCFDNFGYFDALGDDKLDGVASPKGLSHRIFELRILLAEALRGEQYLEESYQNYRNALLDLSHEIVKTLYGQKDKFRVKMRLAIIEKYVKREVWDDLGFLKINEISEQIGPLVILEDKDEKAKLFDALIYRMQLAQLNGDPFFERGKNNIITRSKYLASKSNIPAIKDKMNLISLVSTKEFWKNINLPDLELIRTELRDLMKLLIAEREDPVYENFEDEITIFSEPLEVNLPSAPKNYLDCVKSFIRENKDYIVIKKIRNNQPINEAELHQLEDLLFDGDDRGTKDDFVKATNSERPLGVFIRSILGLERNAAMVAFSEFQEKGSLSANQQKFIECIIDNFEVEGFIEPKQLYEPPYTNIHMEGIDGVFDDARSDNILSIIRGVNGTAGKMSG